MKCIFCGYEVENSIVCPSCGRDLTIYSRIQIASALCYNEGLRKARVRDLSGAIDELTKALKYNKYNTDARNLLGLVYLEIGEPVNAMSEWVISKNLDAKEDNLANKYLAELQRDTGLINRMDSATKKYNQVISYISQGDYDLAKIQLKRLVGKNPSMIRARSLLALLYLHNGEPRAARKELIAAGKIDVGNPTINTYFQEVKEGLRMEGMRGKGRNKGSEFTEETAVAPEPSRFAYIMDYSKVSAVNIIIGAIIGILVSLFLIFPAVKQSANNDALTALISANEDVRSTENDISAMQQTINGLNAKIEAYEGKADVKGSYEALINMINAVNSGDLESASKYYEDINVDLLDTKGKETFGSYSSSVAEYRRANAYAQAKALFAEERFEEASVSLSAIVAEVENYDEGAAMESLAACYENIGEVQKAIAFYTRLSELYPGRRIGRNALSKVEALSPGGSVPSQTQ